MYKIIKFPFGESLIIDREDGISTSIPYDEANTDYQKYLAWVALGNEAEEI
jgi:hypothetical protein